MQLKILYILLLCIEVTSFKVTKGYAYPLQYGSSNALGGRRIFRGVHTASSLDISLSSSTSIASTSTDEKSNLSQFNLKLNDYYKSQSPSRIKEKDKTALLEEFVGMLSDFTSSDKSFIHNPPSVSTIAFEELSKATWLLGSILNIDYADNVNRNSRKLIQSLLKCLNTFFLANVSPVNKSTAIQRDGIYRVYLLRLMSGLEKLGLTWDIVSENEFCLLYLELLNAGVISDDTVSSNVDIFAHSNEYEQSREVASILWTLGRMDFDINNTSHSSNAGHVKEIILDMVWRIFLSSERLKGQTVAMVLKGLSKMGYRWIDFEDAHKPVNSDIIRNNHIGNDLDQKAVSIQTVPISSLASLILSVCLSGDVELEVSELVVVVQALAFMNVSWRHFTSKFQQYVLSVFAERLNELSTKDFSLLVRSLGNLGYDDSCVASTATVEVPSIDGDDAPLAKRMEEGIAKYLLKFGHKFNYFDIECTLQGLNAIKVSQCVG